MQNFEHEDDDEDCTLYSLMDIALNGKNLLKRLLFFLYRPSGSKTSILVPPWLDKTIQWEPNLSSDVDKFDTMNVCSEMTFGIWSIATIPAKAL